MSVCVTKFTAPYLPYLPPETREHVLDDSSKKLTYYLRLSLELGLPPSLLWGESWTGYGGMITECAYRGGGVVL